MESYGKILLIAMPAFFALVLFEKWYGWRKGYDTARQMDMISSLSSGITNITKDVLGLSVAIISYEWLVRHIALVQVPSGWITYLVAFMALDFAGYWVHRLSHEYNLLWNNHIIHHSSEEFNLACALRQSISTIVRLFAIFLLPAALLGVPAPVIAIVAPLHLFAQFWYHTQHIGRMGFLEKIIVTPSHHRVHHAINPEYIDRNYGQIFIFWDKLFGTFQEELPGVPAVYGITRPAQTWNPIKINFMHLWLLIQDAWHAQSWRDKWRIWFMPTGWRPADVAARFPIQKIENVYQFEKYNPRSSPALRAWSWIQLVMLLLLLSYFFARIAKINALNPSYIYLYGLLVFLQVYALTDLMDRNPRAIIGYLLANGFGVGLLLMQRDWFGASALMPAIPYLLGGYFVAGTGLALWFSQSMAREDRVQMAVPH